MVIVILSLSIGLLLVLITAFKMNPFIALILTAIFAGIMQGMGLTDLLKSIQTGIGKILGDLTLILGFGVMLGHMLSETGAAQRISETLIKIFGTKQVKLAMAITGFAVGIAMFYNAGFMILIPLVFTISAQTKLSPVYIGLAMASGLSVTHGFLPPHPGPTAIVVLFKADIGKTLMYGIVVAIPAIILSGLVFPEFVKNIKSNPPKGMFETKKIDEANLPSFGLALLVALTPVFLMAISTISEFFIEKESSLAKTIHFFGDPSISMLIALLISFVFLGVLKGRNMKDITNSINASVGSAALILLIIAAGGAFKQVLIDGGMGNQIAEMFKGSSLSPLFLGWLIAFIIRISMGSATVAGLTAGGIIQPILATSHASPELMVLAIGAGSLMCSHVNDTGFWMFKEYFGLTIKDTFKTWTLMETIVGLTGLAGVLLLNMVI
jgi:Gnt-I system high-affinity gluconate transporter